MDSNTLEKLSSIAEKKWGRVPPEFSGFLLAAFSLGRSTTKSVAGIVEAYEASLRSLMESVVNGTMSADDMAREHRILLRSVDSQAFLEGLAQGGVKGELTSGDEAHINGWLSNQLSHVESFATAAARSEEDIEERLAYWVDNVRALGDLGFASAKKNMMVTFHLGGTKEHCETCSRLDGTRHRLSWFLDRNYIPRQRGNPHFGCGGWKCECELLDDDGKAVLN